MCYVIKDIYQARHILGGIEMAQIRNVEGGIVLENDDLLLTFPLVNGQIETYRLFGRAAHGQTLVARSDPLAEVVFRGSDGEPTSERVVAAGYQMDQRDDVSILRLDSKSYDSDNGTWSASIEFHMPGDGPRVTVVSRLTASSPRQLLAFRSPFLRTVGGETSERPAAMLPGLDWVVDDERTSATGPAPPPFQDRFAPHPYKITSPVMAVSRRGFVVGLTWDPLQVWDGAEDAADAHRYPAAAFASPNFIEGVEHSDLLGLFIPSIPKYVNENELTAARPYQMTPGSELRIESTIFVLPSGNVLDAVGEHIHAHGLIPPPPKPRDYRKNLELDIETYLDRAWSERHSAWARTQGPKRERTFTYNELVALALWRVSLFTKDLEHKRRMRDSVEAAILSHNGSAGLPMAYFRGGFAEELDLEKGRLDKLETGQLPDGGWPEDSPHETRRRKPASYGVTAQNAALLLRSGLLTGDQRHLSAGAKALRLLDHCRRPSGMQADLHEATPDLYVTAHLMSAYLDQYLVTGTPSRLEKAVYWARAGLPFVYLWHAHDRNLMRYATVPLFGVTIDRKPQFGAAAQWMGLVYANQLLRLGRHDKSMRWRRIARAITLCAMHMQKTGSDTSSSLIGFYPDSFNIVDGREYYPLYNNPQHITRNVLHLLGEQIEPNCEAVPWREHRVRIASMAHLLAIHSSPGQITARLAYHPDETCYITFAECTEPKRVLFNDRDLERIEDLADAHRAWMYDRGRGLAIVRAPFDDREATIDLRF